MVVGIFEFIDQFLFLSCHAVIVENLSILDLILTSSSVRIFQVYPENVNWFYVFNLSILIFIQLSKNVYKIICRVILRLIDRVIRWDEIPFVIGIYIEKIKTSQVLYVYISIFIGVTIIN